eukprot:TRINITY_DN11892_c0_g4_i1.p1 TRINITY_DN11892_c0_g4~~TRINITY_DN11892_c0_g4_i1.p1  ORF type:complete len:488 (+),score=117.08 TRINITY_DN11892_c0_g4_i1:87-1550(+)
MMLKVASVVLSLSLSAICSESHRPNVHRDEDGRLHLEGSDVIVNGVSFQELYDMVMRMNMTYHQGGSSATRGPTNFVNSTFRELDATPDIVRNISGQYGRVCAADGEYFACSAYIHNRGLVAVYKLDTNKNNALLQQIIYPPLPNQNYFGWALDMDRDLMVVGATDRDFSSSNYRTGSAYVYRRNSAGQYVYLGNATDGTEANDDCGSAVAVSGNRFAVSCPGQDGADSFGGIVSDGGVVHVYTISAANVIEYQAKLTHTINAGTADRLGGSSQDCMSMYGNTLVVGMTSHEVSSTTLAQGGAAVFEYANNQWTEKTVLYAPDAAMGDGLGHSTVVVDNMIICSAPFHDPNTTIDGSTTASSAGSIYVYMRNSTGSWNFHQRINNNKHKANDRLGMSMDIDSWGNSIVASATGVDNADFDVGALHLFTKDANGMFSLTRTLFHSDAASGDSFGYGASFGNGFIVAGAHQAEDNGQAFSHGKAYVFVA